MSFRLLALVLAAALAVDARPRRVLLDDCPTVYVVAPYGFTGGEVGQGFSRNFVGVNAREHSDEGAAIRDELQKQGCTAVPVRTATVTRSVNEWIARDCVTRSDCLILSDYEGFTSSIPVVRSVDQIRHRRVLTPQCEGIAQDKCDDHCVWINRKYGCRQPDFVDFRTRSECRARDLSWANGRCSQHS